MKPLLTIFCALFLSLGASAIHQPLLNTTISSKLDSLPPEKGRTFSIGKSQPFRTRKSPIVGTSLTYILLDHYQTPIGPFAEHEFTWSLNMAFPFSRKWEAGLNYMSIWTLVTGQEQTVNWIAGAFSQFNVFQTSSTRFFLEGGLYTGNICFCFPEYYTLDNQFYVGLGLGAELRLNKLFSVDIGMNGLGQLFNNFLNPQGHFLYILGINYQF